MNFYWVYDLTNTTFCVLSIVAFSAFGLLGLFSTRGFVRRLHRTDHSHNDIVGYFLSAVTVFYGITLGLVAVGTWTAFSDVESKANAEAQTVASLYRDVGSYAEPWKSELRQDLRRYTRYVIDVSWPMQRNGIIPSGSGLYLEQFQDHLTSSRPTDMETQIVQAEVFKQYNALIEKRRARLDATTTGLPMSIWALVIAGAVFSIAIAWFFDVRSLAMHAWMTGSLAGFLGMMIFLVATLDNPFRGKVSISPGALTTIYDQIMARDATPADKVTTTSEDVQRSRR